MKGYKFMMKNMMIIFLVLCLNMSVGNTNEIKNDLIKSGNAIKETTILVFITVLEDIKSIPEYQKRSWREGNETLARNITKIKSLFQRQVKKKLNNKNERI